MCRLCEMSLDGKSVHEQELCHLPRILKVENYRSLGWDFYKIGKVLMGVILSAALLGFCS